jgi:hypothetical protein
MRDLPYPQPEKMFLKWKRTFLVTLSSGACIRAWLSNPAMDPETTVWDFSHLHEEDQFTFHPIRGNTCIECKRKFPSFDSLVILIRLLSFNNDNYHLNTHRKKVKDRYTKLAVMLKGHK